MELLPGDLLSCYGADWTSRAIRCMTARLLAPRGLRLGPSHVAIACRSGGESLWVESTTCCRRPCVIRNRRVHGVQAHVPSERLQDYEEAGGRVVVYRLTDINALSTAESRLLSRILIKHFVHPGREYDYRGAVLSGTRAFQLTRLFPGADLESLFCSELAAAVLMRLNRLTRGNPTRFHPSRLLRELVRTGTYRALPDEAWRGR